LSNVVGNWLYNFFDLNPSTDLEDEIKKPKRTLPLGDVLTAMDFCNKKFYKNLSEEQKKEISLWTLMRYMSSSCSDSEHHLLLVNNFVNHEFNTLRKHPELQWMLLALCGKGKTQKHIWIKPPKGVKKNPLEQAILNYYPLLKDDEIDMLLNINTKKDFEQFFKDNGYDDKTIKELLKGGVKED
jgi:hypothetical protein